MSYLPPTPAEVRALIARTGLTRTALAAALNCERRAIPRWVGGSTPMPYTVLVALCAQCLGRQIGPPGEWRGPVADLLQAADPSA